MFSSRCQPDLKVAILEENAGELPFKYGYNSLRSHLIFAARKTELTAPILDGGPLGVSTRFVGDGARCNGGQFNVWSSLP